MSLLDILKKYPQATQAFIDGEDLPADMYEELYYHWEEDMPYGTQKARDGDPVLWIYSRLQNEIDNPKKSWEMYKFLIQLPRIIRNDWTNKHKVG